MSQVNISTKSVYRRRRDKQIVQATRGVVTSYTGYGLTEVSPEQILLALLDVDGTGSLLDADLLDGHEGTYFATSSHNHDSVYASASHLHADVYIPLIGSPTNGKFPTINAVGALNNGTYGPSDFAASSHNHDGVYAAASHNHDSSYISIIGAPLTGTFASVTSGGEVTNSGYDQDNFEASISKSTGYLRWTGSAWEFKNESYSLTSHTHSNYADKTASQTITGPWTFGTNSVLIEGNTSYSLGVYSLKLHYGDLWLGDGMYLTLGSDADSYMGWGEGDTTMYFHINSYANATKMRFQGKDASGTDRIMAYFFPRAGCEFYYLGTKRLETTSGGATITGIATATSYATANWTIAESGNALQIKKGTTMYLELNPSTAAGKILEDSGTWISKGSVYLAFVTLTFSSSISWNIANGYNAKVTLTGDTTITISNAANGTSGCLIAIQDSTGGRTITLMAGANPVKVIDGGLLLLNESANKINIITWVSDGTDIYVSYGNNYLSPT
jgi:hypothetical protein